MISTEQLSYWTGYWGDEYLKYNDHNIESFIPFWREILSNTDYVDSILEVGCNIGMNLSTINIVYPDIELTGIEPFKGAVEIARERLPEANIIQGNGFELPFDDNSFDFSCSLGVMIHIAKEHLQMYIDELIRVSKRYILIYEYQIEGGEEGKSRPDLKGYVWKRNYRDMVSDSLNLKPFVEGSWWDGETKWYLFDKENAEKK